MCGPRAGLAFTKLGVPLPATKLTNVISKRDVQNENIVSRNMRKLHMGGLESNHLILGMSYAGHVGVWNENDMATSRGW